MLTTTDLNEIDKRTAKTVKKIIIEANLATKDDVKNEIKRAISDNNEALYQKIAQIISGNNTKLLDALVMKHELYANFVTKKEFNEATNNLQITMDHIYGIVKRNDTEQTVISHQVNNHETRLTKLESAIA